MDLVVLGLGSNLGDRVRHLKDAVAAGDEPHAPALKDMKSRWRRPVSGLKWYQQAKKDFAALPEG